MELTPPALCAFMVHTWKLFHLSRIGIDNEKSDNGMVVLYEFQIFFATHRSISISHVSMLMLFMIMMMMMMIRIISSNK